MYPQAESCRCEARIAPTGLSAKRTVSHQRWSARAKSERRGPPLVTSRLSVEDDRPGRRRNSRYGHAWRNPFVRFLIAPIEQMGKSALGA